MPCQYCDRGIVNKGSLVAHEMSCKMNPNRIQHKRSPFAGKKPGSPGAVAWNKGKKVGRNKIWDEKFPDHVVFSENSTYPRHSLKARIIERKLIDYHCSICGIEPIWNGKPMPLVLDHINGINNDNRLENLRFVCSNCDTQLPTYKSKNRKTECAEVGSSHGLENRSI